MISLGIIVVLLLVIAPWLLSPLMKSAVNRRLAALPDYQGRAGSVRTPGSLTFFFRVHVGHSD